MILPSVHGVVGGASAALLGQAAQLVAVANNNVLPHTYSLVTASVHNCRTVHRSGPRGYRNCKAVFLNGIKGQDSEQNAGYDFYLECSKTIGGTYTQGLSGGNDVVQVSRQWGLAVFDIGDIPANTTFFINNRRVAVDHATRSANIIGATQANPVVVTTDAPHSYVNGAEIKISGVTGMTEINNGGGNLWWKVANATETTFELQTLAGSNVNGTGFTAYASGGLVQRGYRQITNSSGIGARQDGLISGVDDAVNYVMGVNLPEGAQCDALSASNFSSGSIISVPVHPTNRGRNYSIGVSLWSWYGAAGAAQPGSLYPCTVGFSGYGTPSGGQIVSATVTASGSGHDVGNLPLAFFGGGNGYGGSNSANYGPILIIGEPINDGDSILLHGDSNTAGYGSVDGTGDLYASHGMLEQILANQHGLHKFATPGDSALGWLLNRTKQLELIDELIENHNFSLETVIIAMGTNDFLTSTAGTILNQTKQSISNTADIWRGKGAQRIITQTLLPAATSSAGSNKFSTILEQSPYNSNFDTSGNVDQFNDWLRNGGDSNEFDDNIDMNAQFRDSSTTYAWRTDLYGGDVSVSGDGIHANKGAGIPHAVANPSFVNDVVNA